MIHQATTSRRVALTAWSGGTEAGNPNTGPIGPVGAISSVRKRLCSGWPGTVSSLNGDTSARMMAAVGWVNHYQVRLSTTTPPSGRGSFPAWVPTRPS